MSDAEFTCDSLLVKQGLEKGFLSGDYQTEFALLNNISISIEQVGKRTIELKAAAPISCDVLLKTFQNVEKILMLFDGRFYPIEKLIFSLNGQELTDCSSEYEQNRLNYYSSRDFCQYSWLRLIMFQDVLSAELYEKWCALFDDLDIAYQSFLYSLADNKMPIDLNFAFLAELAEPFAELLKEKTCYCQSLSPGERGTTLKMCVDTLIMNFGKDIFADELSGDYADFLDKTVGSRVRIMHIKKNQIKHFEGNEYVKYSIKFSLLYRIILFELLNIDNCQYDTAIQDATKEISKKALSEVRK